MAGLDPESLPGQPLPVLFAGQGQDVESVLRDVIRTGQAVLDRVLAIGVPGNPEVRHWTLNCFPLRDNRGQVMRVGFIALDVTARRNAEAAYRTLSGRLLRLQDEERRRIAREMHDSLGQYLTALKINLEVAASSSEARKAELLSEAVELASTCLSETRTLSHLLHPPLLDEAGLVSAARWYITGFAERSGIKVNLDLPDDFRRLPMPIETAIFRVLQESLTNIHRHARSPAADIHLHLDDGHVRLAIRDFGNGIREDILLRFRQSGTTGVGLAGMRERIFELGGRLDIQREDPGTGVYASIPVRAKQEGDSAVESAA
jgi:signal transduction histidine kinase